MDGVATISYNGGEQRRGQSWSEVLHGIASHQVRTWGDGVVDFAGSQTTNKDNREMVSHLRAWPFFLTKN